MAKVNPLISVIIPVFNCERYLRQAIESVISQNYKPLEIIIVDDGSTDNSASVAKKFSFIKYIYQENSGAAAARNKGLSLVQGEYITFLDSDDLYINDSLSLLSNYLSQNPTVDIVEGRLQQIYQNKKTGKFEVKFQPFYHCLLGCSIFRKSVFKKVDNFEERLTYIDDVDWFTRAWELDIKKYRLDFTSLYYRKHENNLTNNTKGKSQDITLHFKLKLDRQRNNPNRKKSMGVLRDYLGEINVKTQINEKE